MRECQASAGSSSLSGQGWATHSEVPEDLQTDRASPISPHIWEQSRHPWF